jgi:hypothetical protein
MAEMLLINPRKRRKTRRANPARRRTSTHTMALAAAPRRRRRHNPIGVVHRRRSHARRRNPIGMMKRRVMRRRNPSMLGGNYMGAIREALMSGFGAVAIDYAYNMLAGLVPTSTQSYIKPNDTSVGAADAIKAVLTVVLGNALSGVTRGYSRSAAKASLTVQSYQIMKKVLPSTISGNLSGLGYMSPAIQTSGGRVRVGPIRNQMGAYVAPGSTPLLSAYTASGSASPLLSSSSARMREGTSNYR